MDYLLIINDKGERVTSLVKGIHGRTMEDLKKMAEGDYPSHQYIEDDGRLQSKLVTGEFVYQDGEAYPRAEKEETPEESLAKVREEFERARGELMVSFNAALLEGDEDTIEEIREDLQELKKSYEEEVKKYV